MEKTQTFTRKPASWGTSLKLVYANACSTGNKHEEAEIWVKLKSNDGGITEIRWDGWWDCSAAMERYRLGRQSDGVALHVRDSWRIYSSA